MRKDLSDEERAMARQRIDYLYATEAEAMGLTNLADRPEEIERIAIMGDFVIPLREGTTLPQHLPEVYSDPDAKDFKYQLGFAQRLAARDDTTVRAAKVRVLHLEITRRGQRSPKVVGYLAD